LKIGAVVAGRLRADGAGLLGQPGRGPQLVERAGLAAAVMVGGQRVEVALDVGLPDGGAGIGGGSSGCGGRGLALGVGGKRQRQGGHPSPSFFSLNEHRHRLLSHLWRLRRGSHRAGQSPGPTRPPRPLHHVQPAGAARFFQRKRLLPRGVRAHVSALPVSALRVGAGQQNGGHHAE
nr:hypothetical protein [Tanacetum cinerariifolium]